MRVGETVTQLQESTDSVHATDAEYLTPLKFNEASHHNITCMKRISQSQSLKTLLTNGLYPQALKASLPNPKLTDQTYALFIKSGHSLDPYLSTTLISHFSKLEHFSRASKYLFETHSPDTISFNALISGFASFRQPRPVSEIFNTLRHLGLEPDVFTLSSLVKRVKVRRKTRLPMEFV